MNLILSAIALHPFIAGSCAHEGTAVNATSAHACPDSRSRHHPTRQPACRRQLTPQHNDSQHPPGWPSCRSITTPRTKPSPSSTSEHPRLFSAAHPRQPPHSAGRQGCSRGSSSLHSSTQHRADAARGEQPGADEAECQAGSGLVWPCQPHRLHAGSIHWHVPLSLHDPCGTQQRKPGAASPSFQGNQLWCWDLWGPTRFFRRVRYSLA